MPRYTLVGQTLVYPDGSSKLLDQGQESRFLKGYNTYSPAVPPPHQQQPSSSSAAPLSIVSSITGLIEVTDRVVSVRGAAPRYLPEIGDVVVGRVVDLTGTRWRIDINSLQDAVLLLANVTEPGGALRRRGREDELAMRSIFQEQDLLVAEVQRLTPDGLVFLHTRTATKYGRRNQHGSLVTIRPSLVRRTRRQFHTFVNFGVHVIFGMNGMIWVEVASEEQMATAKAPAAKGVADGPVSDDEDGEDDSAFVAGLDGNGNENGSGNRTLELVDLSDPAEMLRTVALFANCISVLAAQKIVVFPRSVLAAVMASRGLGLRPYEVVLQGNVAKIAQAARDAVASMKRSQKRARAD